MDSQIKSATISGVILAIGTLAVTFIVGFLTKYGDVHLFTIENEDKIYVVVLVENWHGYFERNFEILLPYTTYATVQPQTSVLNFESKRDGSKNTIVSFSSARSDSRSILIVNVDPKFNESDASLIDYPFGYILTTGNRISFYSEILKNVVMSIVSGFLFAIFKFYISKEIENLRLINKNAMEKIDALKSKHDKAESSIRSSIDNFKLIILKRLTEANNENSMWRRLIVRVFVSMYNDKKISNEIVREFVIISGGSWATSRDLHDVSYGDVLDILDELRRKKKE